MSEIVNNAIVHYRDDLDLQNLIDFGQKEVHYAVKGLHSARTQENSSVDVNSLFYGLIFSISPFSAQRVQRPSLLQTVCSEMNTATEPADRLQASMISDFLGFPNTLGKAPPFGCHHKHSGLCSVEGGGPGLVSQEGPNVLSQVTTQVVGEHSPQGLTH